jgi:NACHT domain
MSVNHELTREPAPSALYNGSPARYADIASALTIRRVVEEPLLARLIAREINVVTLIGVAGVGKTTLARRIMFALQERGHLAYEHHRDFPFRAGEWIDLEERLRTNGARAALLIDDCTAHLSQLNRLLDTIGQIDSPALSVLAVAERAHWLPRVKSRYFRQCARRNDFGSAGRRNQ